MSFSIITSIGSLQETLFCSSSLPLSSRCHIIICLIVSHNKKIHFNSFERLQKNVFHSQEFSLFKKWVQPNFQTQNIILNKTIGTIKRKKLLFNSRLINWLDLILVVFDENKMDVIWCIDIHNEKIQIELWGSGNHCQKRSEVIDCWNVLRNFGWSSCQQQCHYSSSLNRKKINKFEIVHSSTASFVMSRKRKIVL
jgi:hypothetical protein